MTTRTDQQPQDDPRHRPDRTPPARPRLGFVGVGWIGRHRLESIVHEAMADVVALTDPDPDARHVAAEIAPHAETAESFDHLLTLDLDGVVIATPSALHAQQATAALDRGFAVFSQKPLARTAEETRAIVEAARHNDRLLGVDLSYRHVSGVQQMRQLIDEGALGSIYAADLTFHNAYGPDKPWFYQPHLAGGGCVIDLGVHLADLAMWMLRFPRFHEVRSRLYAGGRRLRDPAEHTVEDCAFADWTFENGATARLACSWNLPAGRDAVIEAAFYGTEAGAVLRNVDGSFWDLTVEHLNGTTRQALAEPPDPWGGRAIVHWTQRLARSPGFDPEAERFVELAALLDAIYGQ